MKAVSVYILRVEVISKQFDLSFKLAKQFPVHSRQDRMDRAVTGKVKMTEPICKINAKTLGELGEWLYLVEDANGLCWESPVEFDKDYEAKIVQMGGWVDHPETVPTVVLV